MFEVDDCNHLTIMMLAEDIIFIILKNVLAIIQLQIL